MEAHEDLRYYLRMFYRRKFQMIVPCVLCLLPLLFLVQFRLPPVYRSSGKILIEPRVLTGNMAQSVSDGFLEERLEGVMQKAFSRENLFGIIERFNLYDGEKEPVNQQQLATRMRKNIIMKTIQVEVFSEEQGRAGSSTYAFSLSFEDQNPEIAVNVANALIESIMIENQELREKQVHTAFDFLEQQKITLNDEVERFERELAEFREKNQTRLPEILQTNLKVLAELQNQVQMKENQIEQISRDVAVWKTKLSLSPEYIEVKVIKEGKFLSAGEEVEQLRREYIASVATRSANHPDVVSLGNRLRALEQELKIRSDFSTALTELEQKEAELAQARKQYSEKHPDVVRLKQELSNLKQGLEQHAGSGPVTEFASEEIEQQVNPEYLNLQSEIEIAGNRLANYTQDLGILRKKLQDYESRVETTSQVEVQYQALARKYENARQRYQEIEDRLLTAREAKGLEESQLSERFTLVEPPVRPNVPVRPKRAFLALLSVICAGGLGFFWGIGAEFFDSTLHDSANLAKISGLAVLVEISHIPTRREKKIRRMKWLLGGIVFVALIGLILAAIHVYVSPLVEVFATIVDSFVSLVQKIKDGV